MKDSTISKNDADALEEERPGQVTGSRAVKMDFHKATNRAKSRKRISRGIAKAQKKIKSLENEKGKLKRKTWVLRKRIHRLREEPRKEHPPSPHRATTPKAPRDKTNSGHEGWCEPQIFGTSNLEAFAVFPGID